MAASAVSVRTLAYLLSCGSELLQQPVDVVQLELRPLALGAAAAQLFLDRLSALTFALLRHCHIGALIRAGATLAIAAAKRIKA